jgi:hypothetical protein
MSNIENNNKKSNNKKYNKKSNKKSNKDYCIKIPRKLIKSRCIGTKELKGLSSIESKLLDVLQIEVARNLQKNSTLNLKKEFSNYSLAQLYCGRKTRISGRDIDTVTKALKSLCERQVSTNKYTPQKPLITISYESDRQFLHFHDIFLERVDNDYMTLPPCVDELLKRAWGGRRVPQGFRDLAMRFIYKISKNIKFEYITRNALNKLCGKSCIRTRHNGRILDNRDKLLKSLYTLKLIKMTKEKALCKAIEVKDDVWKHQFILNSNWLGDNEAIIQELMKDTQIISAKPRIKTKATSTITPLAKPLVEPIHCEVYGIARTVTEAGREQTVDIPLRQLHVIGNQAHTPLEDIIPPRERYIAPHTIDVEEYAEYIVPLIAFLTHYHRLLDANGIKLLMYAGHTIIDQPKTESKTLPTECVALMIYYSEVVKLLSLQDTWLKQNELKRWLVQPRLETAQRAV